MKIIYALAIHLTLLRRKTLTSHPAQPKQQKYNTITINTITPQRKPALKNLGNGQRHAIFIGNLSWDVTPELLEDMVNDVLGPNLFTHGKKRNHFGALHCILSLCR